MYLESIDYHRNGVSGEPFRVLTFHDTEHGPMVGIVFEAEGHCAVFNRALLGQGDIRFGYNSYRGDYYEPQLRAWIKEYENWERW